VAVVTSANLTRKGLNLNAEFGCISQLPNFVKVCRDYFDDLWQRSGPSISLEELNEWEEQVTQYKLAGGKPGTRRRLPDHGVDAGQGDDAPTLEEAPAATGSVRTRGLQKLCMRTSHSSAGGTTACHGLSQCLMKSTVLDPTGPALIDAIGVPETCKRAT
jgi:hypothetical protein